MRTHTKVDTQDQFEPTLIGRAVGVRSLMPKSPGQPFVERTIKENTGKLEFKNNRFMSPKKEPTHVAMTQMYK